MRVGTKPTRSCLEEDGVLCNKPPSSPLSADEDFSVLKPICGSSSGWNGAASDMFAGTVSSSSAPPAPADTLFGFTDYICPTISHQTEALSRAQSGESNPVVELSSKDDGTSAARKQLE
ncbi:uncharacterized protein V6R79_002465 [Siganus canaliculatus]